MARIKKDQDLRDAVALVQSARVEFKKPFFIGAMDHNELKNLALELVQWSEQNEALNIDQFFTKRRLSPMSAYKVAETNPEFKASLDLALANIGSRIEEGIKSNQMYLMNKMKHYSSLSREEARLKREADLENRVVTVYNEETIEIPVFKRAKE